MCAEYVRMYVHCACALFMWSMCAEYVLVYVRPGARQGRRTPLVERETTTRLGASAAATRPQQRS